MKKITFLLILFFAATFSSIAQDYQEVVHLTDGSIIKGFIIEQVPNDYLKIKTTGGKVYLIEMYEVEKITKERPRTGIQNNRQQNTNRYYYPDNRNSSGYGQVRSFSPNRGYKGFIDLGLSIGTTTYYRYDNRYESSGYTESRFEFSTSHGYLFSPYLFIGAGVGFHYYMGLYYDDNYHYDYHYGDRYYPYDEEFITIPIFVHVRNHFINKRISPFADIKLGYSVSDYTGLYFSPSVGCRFGRKAGSRSAFWLSLGYSLQQFDEFDNNYNSSAFSMKVGWDF